MPLRYYEAARHVEHLIDTRGRFECPVVSEVTKPVERKLRELADQRSSQRLLSGPRDPETKALLRRCVEHLEAKPAPAAPKVEAPGVESPTLPLTDAELQARARRKQQLREQAGSL